MSKIALAVITRDNQEDSILLKRLLDSVSEHVSGIYITAASKERPGYIKKVCEEYNAEYSTFDWVKDFSKARNFNFSQVPKDYDYILWSDVDDVWDNAKQIPELIKSNADSYSFWYLYSLDEDNQPTVVHRKTMIIKNDGSFEWKGAIHEDLMPLRQISHEMVEDVKRVHLTNDDRVEVAKARNLDIAKKESKSGDPRDLFNYANSLMGLGKNKEAVKVFESFIETTGSKEEKYLIIQRKADALFALGETGKAIETYQQAIGFKPEYPDAYLQLGKLFFDIGKLQEASEYTLMGLSRRPSYSATTVFNPRDYDYNPLNLLAKIYFQLGKPDKAYACIEACLEINNNPKMRELRDEMKIEVDRLKEVHVIIEELKKIKDKAKLKKKLDSLPQNIASHPGICSIRNNIFIKEKSSGKDLAIYCGYTVDEWNPQLFRTRGFGGSEEAIIHLSKQFSEKGFNVQVYANVGPERMIEDNVEWIPFWEYNVKDKQDYTIFWRGANLCDYDINSTKIFIDVHDTIPKEEFTEKRLAKIDKIFVKTQAHKELYPNVPDSKFAVIPNGIKIEDFEGEIEKDPYLIINTSSPDRSLEPLSRIIIEVKKQVPEAKCKWAYGWDLYKKSRTEKHQIEWMEKTEKLREEAGIEYLGKIPQSEVVGLYKQANIMLYPTEFYEIDCISVKKAQLAGCKVITTDFAALDESVQHGVKIKSIADRKNWAKAYTPHFGSDPKLDKAFVDETVKALKKGIDDRKAMVEWAKKFDWSIISDEWIKNF